MDSTFHSARYQSQKDMLNRRPWPQRQSRRTPTKYDGRYTAGISQHADFDDSPQDRTTWNDLNSDNTIARSLLSPEQYRLIDGSDTECSHEASVEASPTAESALFGTYTPKHPVSRSLNEAVVGTFEQVRFTSERDGATSHEKTHCQLPSSTSTTVKDDTMSTVSPALQVFTRPKSASKDNIMMPALPENPHLNEERKDQTYDFNMSSIRTTLRNASAKPSELVKSYNWYPDAVAVDALLPPGVPLSLKEMFIYYPHHVRWQHVMLRLTHNDYRGSDILGIQAIFRGPCQDHMSAPVMNQIQRDTVQRPLPAFKTTGYEGKGDSDMQTGQFHPGTYLEKKIKGYTVPSFDDLLRGLAFVPTGRDARKLTQCLIWYLGICDTFRPRLELNVLHAQALIRALRQPLEPVGTQNLNRYALEQWRGEEAFDKVKVMTAPRDGVIEPMEEQHVDIRAQAIINIRKEPIDMEIQVRIRIRHVLSFPFLALHGVFSEALKLGIEKAELRKAVRKGLATPTGHAMKTSMETKDIPQHAPKRTRKAESAERMMPAQKTKRQRRYDDGLSGLGLHTPRRPTVSPITPHTSLQRLGPRKPTTSFIEKRSSPLKYQSAPKQL